MRDFSKSVASASLAMSLFGARQMYNVVTQPPRSGESDRATEAFNAMAQAATDQCSEALRETYHAADKIQREAVNAGFRVLSLDAFSSYGATEALSGMVRQAAEQLQRWVGQEEAAQEDVFGDIGNLWFPGAASAPQDILSSLSEGPFNTLRDALAAAGLSYKLSRPGPLTLFAPSDEAFARLPEGRLADWLRPENRRQLRDILSYHLVPARCLAAQLSDLAHITASNRRQIPVQTGPDGIRLGTPDAGAKIETADMIAANGVIHVIDAVLLPEERR